MELTEVGWGDYSISNINRICGKFIGLPKAERKKLV